MTVAVDGTFSYTPNSTARHNASPAATNSDKTDSFTVTIVDGHGGTATVPVTVTIGTANTAPSATATVARRTPPPALSREASLARTPTVIR